MIDIVKCFIISIVLLQVYSCTPIRTMPEIGKLYKMDLFIKNINPDVEFSGMGVIKTKDLISIQVEASERLDYIQFRTCSRTYEQRDPRRGLSSKRYLYNYTPNEIEKNEIDCPMVISTFNDKGYYDLAYISFESSRFILPAINICGERTYKSNGTSVCQEKIDSIEKISFEEEVITSPRKECLMESPLKGKEFSYKVKPNFCEYIFMSLDGKRMAKHTTYGYTDVLISL